MRPSFKYVASCAIKAKYRHRVPKYRLIYATRHEDGLELMRRIKTAMDPFNILNPGKIFRL